jgi:hypothetical protein
MTNNPYNNPWFDFQRQGQLGNNQQGQGGQLPNPFGYQDPNLSYGGPANNYDYYGLYNQQGQGQQQGNPMNMNNFMGGGNNVGATTQPVFNPDVNGGRNLFGNSGGSPFGSSIPDFTQWPGYAGTDPQDPGIPIDKNGHQLPNPYGPLPPSGLGSSGTSLPYGNPADKFGTINSTGQGSTQTYGDPSQKFGTITPTSVIPTATDNYGPGMIKAMQDSAAANAASKAQAQAAWTPPGGAAVTGPNYANLYGGGIAGAQQGFNELNNQQFTDNGAAFNSVFGSTQGQGAGNNFNWNVYPQFSADQLDPTAQQQIISIAQANPQYDFEPTMVNGKWVLASRARDISQQKSLLAPVLPPVNTGGGGGGGGGVARSSSGGGGGGYTKYPTSSKSSGGGSATSSGGKTTTSGGGGGGGGVTAPTDIRAEVQSLRRELSLKRHATWPRLMLLQRAGVG